MSNIKKYQISKKKNQNNSGKKYERENENLKKEKVEKTKIKEKEIEEEKSLNILKEIERKEKEIEELIEDEYSGLSYNKNIEIEIDKKSEKKKKKKSGDTKDFRTKWKTEICHYWEMNNYCKYGDNCAFAHGENELKNRKMSFNYKTKLCKQFFENGYCNYGSRCQFSHKKLYDNYYVSYLKCLNEFNHFEKIDENMLKRPRLLTFEIIYHSNQEETKENRIQLYEDFISVNHNKLSDDNTSVSSNNNNSNFYFNFNKRNRFMSA